MISETWTPGCRWEGVKEEMRGVQTLSFLCQISGHAFSSDSLVTARKMTIVIEGEVASEWGSKMIWSDTPSVDKWYANNFRNGYMGKYSRLVGLFIMPIFLEQCKLHSKIEEQVQRFPTHPLPHFQHPTRAVHLLCLISLPWHSITQSLLSVLWFTHGFRQMCNDMYSS